MPLPLTENTLLQFPSMQHLWEFQKHVQLGTFSFDTSDCTLRAALTEAQQWLALSMFGGKVKSQTERAEKTT